MKWNGRVAQIFSVIFSNNSQKRTLLDHFSRMDGHKVMKFLVIMVIRAAYLRDGDGSQILGEWWWGILTISRECPHWALNRIWISWHPKPSCFCCCVEKTERRRVAACVEVWKKSDCISHNLSLVLLQQQQSASKQTAVEAAFLSLLMSQPFVFISSEKGERFHDGIV